jgi:uncharacterized RDD family membrane protein YckC
VSPEFGLLIQQPQAGAALFFLLLPLILVVETIVFERFETTPGKSFLGIHITTVNAQTLTWEQYLKTPVQPVLGWPWNRFSVDKLVHAGSSVLPTENR